MKGPDSMSDLEYLGLQILTRTGNDNVRRHGKLKGRWWTPPIGGPYGGPMAEEMLRWWSQIVTDGTVENHARRGVNVRTVFFAKDDQVATKTGPGEPVADGVVRSERPAPAEHR